MDSRTRLLCAAFKPRVANVPRVSHDDHSPFLLLVRHQQTSRVALASHRSFPHSPSALRSSIARSLPASFHSSLLMMQSSEVAAAACAASSSSSGSVAASVPAFLSRPGVDVSAMDAAQAAYMAKDKCILVNRKDEAIGFAAKQDCHLNTVIKAGNGLHRAFSVFLFNNKNELMLQRRAAEKPTFPLRWTNTCCSHPLYDTPEAEEKDHIGVKRAAIRKLDDELGIRGITEEDLVFLTRVHYCAQSDGKWGEHEIDHLMFCQKEVEFSGNPNEVCEVKYVSAAALRDEFSIAKENPEHLTPWFQMISEQLLFGWWENGRLAEVMKQKGLGKEEEALIRVLTLEGKPDTFIPEQTP